MLVECFIPNLNGPFGNQTAFSYSNPRLVHYSAPTAQYLFSTDLKTPVQDFGKDK